MEVVEEKPLLLIKSLSVTELESEVKCLLLALVVLLREEALL